jgi:serine/threonine protein kinase
MSSESAGVAAAGVKEGDVLAGKYRVDRVLGVGGMGVVVAAHHLHLDERVAIKFLLPEALSNPEAVARFDREARAAVKIKSEHVARVIDVGKLASGAPYMVMEYLDGRDLSVWLKERGPLPVEQAVDFVLQACEAIAEAHAMGIVHRDLKPANLYCIRRPDGALAIKVLDFGISKATGASMGMTATQSVMGSPLYMSPEQMESSKAVDARGDIWALGIILFELVTGRVPFDGLAITELVLKIVTAQPPTLHGNVPNVPAGLDRIIHRCLEKKRDDRYASVSELANDLVAFAPPHSKLSVARIAGVMNAAGMPARPGFHSSPPGVHATQVLPGSPPNGRPGAGAASTGQTGTDSSWGQTGGGAPKGSSGSRVGLVVGIAAAFALLAVGTTVLLVRKAPPVSAASVAPSSPPSAPLAPSGVAGPTPPTEAPSSSAADDTTPSAAPSSANPPGPTPVRPATPPTHPTTTATAPGPAKPPSKASCDPPYFLDSAGHRQYKPECL